MVRPKDRPIWRPPRNSNDQINYLYCVLRHPCRWAPRSIQCTCISFANGCRCRLSASLRYGRSYRTFCDPRQILGMLHGSTAALAEWILAFADNITDIICEMPVGSIAFPLMMECSLVFLSLGWTFCLLGQANIYTICTVDPEPRYIQYGEYLPSQRGHKMESMVTGIRDDEGVAILDQLLGPRPSWSPKGSRVDPYQGVDEWVRSWMWYRIRKYSAQSGRIYLPDLW